MHLPAAVWQRERERERERSGESECTNGALSVEQYVEYPRGAHCIDGRNKDLIELQLWSVYVLGYQLNPRHPADQFTVPEVLKHRRLHSFTHTHTHTHTSWTDGTQTTGSQVPVGPMAPS